MRTRCVVVLLATLAILSGHARADGRNVLLSVEVPSGDSASQATIERVVRESGMQPARDPLFDPSLPAATLASYVASKGDALGLVIRIRQLDSDLAVEVRAVREVVIRQYVRSTPAGLQPALADAVRIALGSLADLVARGVEVAPGPPRVALVVDDPTLRASLEGSLTSALAQRGALPLPFGVVSAARSFLSSTGDPAANTLQLREALDADRLVLIVRDASGIHVHAIDPTRSQSRDLPGDASPTAIAEVVAGFPQPSRRAPLRTTATTSGAPPLAPATSPTTATSTATGIAASDGLPRDERGHIVWSEVPATRVVTGPYANWQNLGHFALVGAVAFKDESSLYGLGLTDTTKITILSNRPGRTTHLSAYGTVLFHWKSENDVFVGLLPLFHGGLAYGVQTDSWWTHAQVGVGGVATVVGAPGVDLTGDVSKVFVLGNRFGLNITGWKGLSAKPDLVVFYAGFDVVLHADGNFYVAMAGIGI